MISLVPQRKTHKTMDKTLLKGGPFYNALKGIYLYTIFIFFEIQSIILNDLIFAESVVNSFAGAGKFIEEKALLQCIGVVFNSRGDWEGYRSQRSKTEEAN